MQQNENKKLVRRFYEDIFNTGNTDLIERFISTDYAEIHDGVRYEIGVDGAKAHVAGVHRTYSNLHITIDRQIAEGEWVATCITVKGTHKGEWSGIKPTGKPVMFTGVNVDRVVKGRIVEHGGAANMLGPLLKIGAVRAVGPG